MKPYIQTMTSIPCQMCLDIALLLHRGPVDNKSICSPAPSYAPKYLLDSIVLDLPSPSRFQKKTRQKDGIEICKAKCGKNIVFFLANKNGKLALS